METLFSALATAFDLPILDWIAANLRCPFLDVFMPLITKLGDGGVFWILLSLLFILIPNYRKAGFSAGTALLIGLVVCNLIMKPLFARIRPYDFQLMYLGKTIDLLVPAMHDFSFPSGHTIASVEAATAFALRHKKLGIPACILAALIAFSRLYLYVHYPTDVIASIIFGVLIGFLSTRIVDHCYQRYQHKN